MPLRKLKEGEIAIFGPARISKCGEYWQFQMWLERKGKYACKSLRPRSENTVIEHAKQMYFEIFANKQ